MPKPIEIKPAPTVIRQEARLMEGNNGWERFVIPPWGYVEEFTVIFPQPIPLIETTSILQFEIQGRLNGQTLGGYRVISTHRNVEFVL